MNVTTLKQRRPAYAICLIAPEGAGKTQQGLSFPKVYYIGTDPTGLDTVLWNPEWAMLAKNLAAGNVLNGLPLADVFADDETSERSIYGNIAKAVELAAAGEIRTIFLDNLTYLLKPMYWQYIDGDNSPNKYQPFNQLETFASDLVLSRLLPLATRNGINIVISMHIQREREEIVKGAEAFNSGRRKPEEIGASKRHVNLESDLSPAILGSLRERIGGMPSAMIWLNNEPQSDGTLTYMAYCQRQKVQSWDAEVQAKNRYGLPRALNLTNASLYATLIEASKRAMKAREVKAAKEIVTTVTADVSIGSPGQSAASTPSDSTLSGQSKSQGE